MVGTSNQSVPEMAIDNEQKPEKVTGLFGIPSAEGLT